MTTPPEQPSRPGWDGHTPVDEPDPDDREKRRIARLMADAVVRTGDEIDPAVFYVRRP